MEYVKATRNNTGFNTAKAMGTNVQKNNFLNVMQNETAIDEFIQRIIDGFDFLGIVERMDESLVLLSCILDIPVSDVLYTNAKVAGGYMIKSKESECRQIGTHRPLEPVIQAFLDSDEWSEIMKFDNLLYDAVNRSIDYTIEHVIGQNKFDVKMKEFLAAKDKVDEHCTHKFMPKCNSNGTKIPKDQQSKCYEGDVGCGYECLDELYPV